MNITLPVFAKLLCQPIWVISADMGYIGQYKLAELEQIYKNLADIVSADYG